MFQTLFIPVFSVIHLCNTIDQQKCILTQDLNRALFSSKKFRKHFEECWEANNPLFFILWTKNTDTSVRIYSFVYNRRKQIIQIWNDMSVNKL